VLYDLEMVEHLAKRQVDLIMGSPQPLWKDRMRSPVELLARQDFEVNAMLESQLLHARALVAFFWDAPPTPKRVASNAKRGKTSKSEDYFAEQWFTDPMAWRLAREKCPERLRDLPNRVSREMAHVTGHRAEFGSAGPPWNVFAVYVALQEVMDRFAAKVDPPLVCHDFHKRVAAGDSTRTAQLRAMPLPGWPLGRVGADAESEAKPDGLKGRPSSAVPSGHDGGL
jgi:hypothetical protein